MSDGYVAVLGGNDMACPAIARLKSAGHAVLSVDGKADAPARELADRFVHQDFSDVAATAAKLADCPIAGVIALNDFAVHAAARLARDRGLPGWNAFAERCATSKVAMKRAWIDAGLATPACAFGSVAEVLAGRRIEWDRWPAVVKPSFSGGGSRGVFVANDWPQVAAGLAAVRGKYLDGDLLLEEFIAGTEHTLEVLVCGGAPTILSISDKENYPGNHTIVQNLYFPGPTGHAHRAALEALVSAAVRAMQMSDGTAHFEVLLCNGQPWLLEVGGRPGGGLNFHPICELSTGYDYPAMLAAVATGKRPGMARKPHVHLAWHYFPAGDGVLKRVEGFEQVKEEPDVVDARLYEKPDHPRLDLADDLARPGYVLVKGGSHQAARARAAQLVERVKFVTQ